MKSKNLGWLGGSLKLAALLCLAVLPACTLEGVRIRRNGLISSQTVTITSPEVIAHGDFNDDTIPDWIISTPSGVTVFVTVIGSDPNQTFHDAIDIPFPEQVGAVKGGNLDRQAIEDLVMQTPSGMIFVLNPVLPSAGVPTQFVSAPVVFGPDSFCTDDFDGDGDDDIAVCMQTSPDPSTLRVYINATPPGQSTIPAHWQLQQTIQDLPAPNFAFDFTSVSAGRINNDAHPDLLVCGHAGCYALAGNGDGTFDPIDPSTGATIKGGALSAGAVPGVTGVIAGLLQDLDRDGDSDMVLNVLSTQPSQIVRLGNGTGTFGPSQFFGGGVTGHRSPVIADFNGDGTLDIVTLVSASSTTLASNQLCLTLVNTDGTLQPTLCTPTMFRPTSAAIFQPDPDELPGLIVTAKFDNRAMLHRNIGGSLRGLQRFNAAGTGGARDIAVGDLTGDGYPDVYFSTMSSFNQVLVNRGDGSGRVDAAPIAGRNASNLSPIVYVPRPGLAAGTVVLARAANSSLFFSEIVDNGGKPQFRFPSSSVLALPGVPRDIIAGDFNGDSVLEPLALLSTANPGVAVAFQGAAGVFATPQGFDLSGADTPQGWWTSAGLIESAAGADGLAVCGPGGAGVLINNGAGFDFFPAMDSNFSGGVRVASGDLNGDGRADLVVARSLGATTGALAVVLDIGSTGQNPTFGPPTTINLIGSPGGLGLSDLDNDGDLDIGVVCNDGSPTQQWAVTLLNDGGGLFPPEDTTTHLSGTTPRDLILADLHNPSGVRGVQPSTAGAEFVIASGGPPATNFEGVLVLMNQADFAAPPSCPGDADGDRVVNFGDVVAVLQRWGTTPSAFGPGDANGDARVDFSDIIEVLRNWARVCVQ
ncbi:MAG: FG-GAP-like repeat-containing protein [Planctomycetota bacterium]|nr:FG-GAP-like repeat-containing protein [Planctomycetota bacterium]